MTVLLPSTAETDLAKFALSLQQLAAGRSNASGTVTLATGAASTVVSAVNCSPTSAVFLFPKTADAVPSLTVKVQKFTASGTYTPSSGMVYCTIECVGGGGGGGGTNGAVSSTKVAGGGGAGSYSRTYASAATVGASQAVTIGALGGGGAANTVGTAGGATSVGAICIANGGSGGPLGAFSNRSGAGGSAGTGDIAAPGQQGPSVFGDTSAAMTISCGGAGASSPLGGGGGGGLASVGAAAGLAATGFGAGGGGSSANNTTATAVGGNASAGIAIVTEYCFAGAASPTFVSSVGKQTFTISHDNNAIADRTYFYVCLG